MKGKYLLIFFLSGLCDVFVYGDVQYVDLQTRFCRSKYAFKFRVLSATVLQECFYPGGRSDSKETPTTDEPVVATTKFGGRISSQAASVTPTRVQYMSVTNPSATTTITRSTAFSKNKEVESDSVPPSGSSLTREQPTTKATTHVANTITTRNVIGVVPTSAIKYRLSSGGLTKLPVTKKNKTNDDTKKQSTATIVSNTVTKSPTRQNTFWTNLQKTVHTKENADNDTQDLLLTITRTSRTTSSVSPRRMSTEQQIRLQTTVVVSTKEQSNPEVRTNDLTSVTQREPSPTTIITTDGVAEGPPMTEMCMRIRYQRIKIVKKHIYKGSKKMQKMKIVHDAGMFYNSTLRLGINLGKGFKPGHYLFMGRAIPNGKDENDIFLADVLNVVPWTEARKDKERLFMKHKDVC